jgi:phosphoribulokinase
MVIRKVSKVRGFSRGAVCESMVNELSDYCSQISADFKQCDRLSFELGGCE